jgi:glycosyltransferase involved in cell wall biosynthesis
MEVMSNTSNIKQNTSGQLELSIIVPVYNVAPYLRKCVDSLLAQDISDYEIILVDDGSTDESGIICDEYATSSLSTAGTSPFSEADHSIIPIRVIHQENGGLSAARNSGVKIANGDYLMFVDSDDYIEPNVLGKLMAQVERDDLDVLRFDYQNVRITSEGLTKRYEVFEPYKRSHRLENDYSEVVTDGVTFLNTRMSTACYAVMFILRRDMILNLKSEIINHKSEIDDCLFTPGIYFEDTDWTPRMLVRAYRVASTNTVVYNYLQREGSITKAVNRSKQQKVLDDKMRLIGEMQRQSNELQEKGLNNVWFSRMIAGTVISVIGILSKDFYSERKGYLEQLKQMNVYPLTSKSTKAKLINLSPRLAVELLHLKNR